MGRSVVNVLIVVAALTGTALGQARCAAACAAKECANHRSQPRPAEPIQSGCPHNTAPHEKPQDQQPCPQKQLIGESWLLSAKALASPVIEFDGGIATLVVVSVPPLTVVESWAVDPAPKLPLHLPLTVPLRI